MKTAFFLTFLFLSVIRTCYSQGLLGSFVDFFNVNAPVDSLNSSADGFPDFPPDPDFPPSSGPGLDPGAGPDTGSWADVGLPPDTGFPGDPPANVNTDIAVSGTASQNVPIDAGIPSGTESTLTTNQKTVIGQSQPADLGPTVGQISPVDKTLSAPSSTNIGDSTNPIDPIIPGLPGPLDPGLDGLPPQSGSLTPVDITAGGLPTQPESLTPIDVNAGGLLAQATEVGANLPPFVIDSGDQQGGASQGSTGPTRLDFHFLPKLPDGGNFVNLITGQTNTFRPSLGWIGDPGRPADISVEGPGSSGPLVDSAPVDTSNSNPDPPLSTSIIDVPADANLPPSNLPPEPPVTQPAAPATPIETNPSVEHKGPFFVDPLAAFFDAAPADNQGPTQPDTTSLTDSSISGGNQDVITGNQGGAISGSSVPETISPSGNQAGIFTLFDNQGPTQPDTTSFTDNSILGGNSDVITGNQGGAVSSSSIPETISPSVNQAGIFTLFDLNEASSASQSLANNKPAVLPFETPGMVIPVETNVVQQKERVPDSWVQLYPEGREPRRRVMGFASQSAPQETIEVSAADRILADLSLGSFGRNRDLQRQLRKKRKQQRKQKRLQRQQGRQRQQELQSQRQQPARRQSARQQTRGRNPRRGRLNRQRQTARLTMPSGQSHSDVEYHVISEAKDSTIHHRRYKRNAQVCDPFSRLVGLCPPNGMEQIQTQLVNPAGILTSNTEDTGNNAKPSIQAKNTPVAQTSVQSQVIDLPHILGRVSNNILPGLAPMTPEAIAVKNPVSQIFGQILNEAGQVANQGLSDLSSIINTPGTNTKPLFEGLANVLGTQPIAQVGNVDLSPLGPLGEGVIVSHKGVPNSKPGKVIEIKPNRKQMGDGNKRNKPIVKEVSETRPVDLSQSLGHGPAGFPSNGGNVISDPDFLNNPVNLALHLGPILSGTEQAINTIPTNSEGGRPLLNPFVDLIPGDLSQSLGPIPANHILDTHTGVPILLPSKSGKKNKGPKEKIRGANENRKPSFKEAGQMVPVNLSPSLGLGPDRSIPSDGTVLSNPVILSNPINAAPELGTILPDAEQIATQALNPQPVNKGSPNYEGRQPISPLVGDLSQPLGALLADHVLDTHTGVPILLPSKMGKKSQGLKKQVKDQAKQDKATIEDAGQIMPINLSPSLGLDPTGSIRNGGFMLSDPTVLSNSINIAPALGPILSDAEQLAITGVNTKPVNIGPANYEGRQPVPNPLVDTTSVGLSQPLGVVPVDHLLDSHTGILDSMPLKKRKKNKGRRKQMKGGNKRKKQNVKEAGPMKSADLSQQFNLGKSGDISNGGILLTDPIIVGSPSELDPLGINSLDQVSNIHPDVQETMPLHQKKKNRGAKKPMKGGNKRKKPFMKKVSQMTRIDLSQHLGQGPVESHVIGGSLVSGPSNLDNPMELSLGNTVFLDSEQVAGNPAVLSAGDSHGALNSLTQLISNGPASYEGRQRIVGQPSNVNPIDLAQSIGPVPTEQVPGTRKNGRNPKARRRRRRRNRMIRNRNKKNRRTNAQRRPVMREVVQMKPVVLPQPPRQGSNLAIQSPEALLGVQGKSSGPGEIKLLSTKVNVEGSNIQSDGIHPDVTDHVSGPIDHSVPLKKRKNPRALARQRLKIIRKLRQQNRRMNQQNRGNQQNRRNQQNMRRNQQNKRGNQPKKGKAKVAKKMETVNLSNPREKLPVTQSTPNPNLECFTGICIDWSGKKK